MNIQIIGPSNNYQHLNEIYKALEELGLIKEWIKYDQTTGNGTTIGTDVIAYTYEMYKKGITIDSQEIPKARKSIFIPIMNMNHEQYVKDYDEWIKKTSRNIK